MAEITDGPAYIGDLMEKHTHTLDEIIERALVVAGRNRVLKEIYYFLDGKETLTPDEIHDIMTRIEEVIEVK